MTNTNKQSEYIKAWKSHIDSLHLLTFTPSRELSEEIKATIEKLNELVVKVANDKGLK